MEYGLEDFGCAAQPPIAVAGVLRAVVGGEDRSLEEALRLERDAVRRCSNSADQVEGMMTFLEKCPPRFEGKSFEGRRIPSGFHDITR